MKKFITILSLFTCIFFGIHDINAQSKGSKKEKILTDIVEKADKWGVGEKIPGWGLIKAKATGKKTLMGLSLGYGNLGLTDFNDDISFDGGTQWSIRLKIIFYQNHHFSIHTGIGYESNIFNFKDVSFSDNNGSAFSTDEKMVARYFTVPLQFKYKLSKSLSVHAGFIGGLNFNTSHTGEKFLWGKDDIDYTARKEFKNFNPVKFDIQAGLTLYHVTFYLKYGLLDSFESDSNLSAHAMSWGISLGI
ncbi:MAG: outer membrane beta-barrel protein [Bacteroidales bacterium]|nr:outer membrane beta-barrel protein [Bacteroidales bacterium]